MNSFCEFLSSNLVIYYSFCLYILIAFLAINWYFSTNLWDKFCNKDDFFDYYVIEDVEFSTIIDFSICVMVFCAVLQLLGYLFDGTPLDKNFFYMLGTFFELLLSGIDLLIAFVFSIVISRNSIRKRRGKSKY